MEDCTPGTLTCGIMQRGVSCGHVETADPGIVDDANPNVDSPVDIDIDFSEHPLFYNIICCFYQI